MKHLIFTVLLGATLSLASSGAFAQEEVTQRQATVETHWDVGGPTMDGEWMESPYSFDVLGSRESTVWERGDDVRPTWAIPENFDRDEDLNSSGRDTAELDDDGTDNDPVLRDEEGGPWPMSFRRYGAGRGSAV